MEIDDTIQTLTKIRQSIDKWVPQRTTRPDALIEIPEVNHWFDQ